MPIPKRLEELYSIEDDSGQYKGAWFSDKPRDPTACFKYYLAVENKKTGKRTFRPAKKFRYWGPNQPYFELLELEFNDEGLVAEVQRITDVTSNRRVVHLAQHQKFKDIIIKIPRRKFPA